MDLVSERFEWKKPLARLVHANYLACAGLD
jgi:hypothetical protein